MTYVESNYGLSGGIMLDILVISYSS